MYTAGLLLPAPFSKRETDLHNHSWHHLYDHGKVPFTPGCFKNKTPDPNIIRVVGPLCMLWAARSQRPSTSVSDVGVKYRWAMNHLLTSRLQWEENQIAWTCFSHPTDRNDGEIRTSELAMSWVGLYPAHRCCFPWILDTVLLLTCIYGASVHPLRRRRNVVG